jgi:hypothetical protein
MYNDLQPQLKNIKTNPEVVNRTFGNLKKNPLFQTQQGMDVLNDWKQATLQQPEMNSLKELRSSVYDDLGPNSSAADHKRLDAINDAITDVRKNSIEATKNDLPKEMHGEVDNLQNQLALADSAHASNIEDLNAVKGLIGNRPIGSPSQFINRIADMKEADLAQKAANLDVSSMRSIKDQFPAVYEKVKNAKINDMVQNSTNPISGFNDAKFFKQYGNLDNEMKDLIFSPEDQAHIENLQTVRQAVPSKLGPSGTPGGQMMMQALSPTRNAQDFAIRQAMKNPSMPSETMQNINPANQKNPIAPAIVKMAKGINTQPNKGYDKWYGDGFQNVMDSASAQDKQMLQSMRSKILSDPKGKQLLLEASSLKPGSKRLDRVLSDIKELK